MNRWTEQEHALNYLGASDRIPHRREGEEVLLEHLPAALHRVLDLGTGDGRLLAIILSERPEVEAIALDFSPTMLDRARSRFAGSGWVTVIEHNLDHPLPELGTFGAVVSSFAIHHCGDERKRSLYAEIFQILEPGGVFCNLEHVASPTPRLHERFMKAMGESVENEDPSNHLLDVETQLAWMREIGFEDVDCYWKWLELALLMGRRPEDGGLMA